MKKRVKIILMNKKLERTYELIIAIIIVLIATAIKIIFDLIKYKQSK